MTLTHPNYQIQLHSMMERGFTVTNTVADGVYLAHPNGASVFIAYMTGIVRTTG